MTSESLLDEVAMVTASSAGRGDGALLTVTGLSVAVIARCDVASLSLVGTGGIVTKAATEPLAEILDEIQYRTGEGPCLDAIHTGTISRPSPPGSEARWPAFRRESDAHGLLGTLSAPVRVEEKVVGSLNLYAKLAPFELTERDELLGAILASSAAQALAARRAADEHQALVDQLNQALASRDIIGQAKGILMAREGCNSDQAFDMLRRASQRLNKKLRDVADDIVQSASSGPSARRRG